MSKLFPAAIHIHGFSSSRDSLYLLCSQLSCTTFSIHWPKQRSASLLHPRYCWRCNKCQNSWMLWWLPGQLAVGVRVFRWKDTQLGIWMFKKRTCQNTGILRVQGWPWCLIPGPSYSLQFTLHSHGLLPHHSTTDWKSFLYLISQPHTHTHTHTKHLVSFWEMGHESFLNFCTWWRSYPWSLFMKQIIVFTL